MKQHTGYLLSFLIVITLCGCSRCSLNETINKGSKKAGEAVGNAVQGMSSGIEDAFNTKVEISDDLQKAGLKTGQILLGNAEGGTDNMLSIYFIFENDISRNITCKAFDKKGLEMGRASNLVQGKKGDAQFVDFTFDKRTNIDSDSKVTIE
ncbi:MAG: hypothetical protein KIT80_15450 [Chitinophagaceae bacterium]|nr:hypothetical protein [Chitinophagaceae bacterium]MCW5928310.1 hypothetical protein [Chitinophagaceae bacterium]